MESVADQVYDPRMRILVVPLVGALWACGSSNNKSSADAPPKNPDAKVFMDAPAQMDAPAMGAFSCYGKSQPTTAANPITVAGKTQELSTSGPVTAGMVTVVAYKTGTTAPLSTVTSDATGAFTTGNLNTGGVPLDGYIKASKGTTYRTTYLYTPNPLVANLMSTPVLLVTEATFGTVATITGNTQDDTANGALIVTVADCMLNPLTGATLSVKQGGNDVGTQYDLGQLSPTAAGFFVVFNVPDGATEISASYQGMNFPAHTVVAHKRTGGLGTLTISAVQPGPTS
jgi:hypothetical protein